MNDTINRCDEDHDFMRAYAMVRHLTVVSIDRLYMLWQLVRMAPDGDMAELGVYRGGSARLIHAAGFQRDIHLYDTFNGMPETDPALDVHVAGQFADTSLKNVAAFFRATHANMDKVHAYEGEFPETFFPTTYSFVHIDADIHKSVKNACMFFWPRMNPGGIMVFDDYGFTTCPGARKAVDEYFGRQTVYLPTGQCFVVSGS